MASKGVSLDTLHSAGGTLKSINQDFVTADGHLIIVLGDEVKPHPATLPHTVLNHMVTAVPWITINGFPMVVEDKLSSCGHHSNGSDWLKVDE